MKHKWILFAIILTLMASYSAEAQRQWKNIPENRQRPEQLDKYRKMRLIEFVNLNEEEAIRYFAKENAHREKMKEIIDERNKTLDELDKIIKEEKVTAQLEKYFLSIREIDNKMQKERERYQDELKSFLSPVQFGKLLIFERNFGNRLREAFDELHRGRDRREE